MQTLTKVCLNCIQSPSITNRRMFYMDRWSEEDFISGCISLIEPTFSNQQQAAYLQITNVYEGDFSISGETSGWAGNDPGDVLTTQCRASRRVMRRAAVSQITTWSIVTKIFQRILDDVKRNPPMGNWGLGENESLSHLPHNWLARHHNSFRLHSLTVIRIYKIVFSRFLWLSASKTNHRLATHCAHLTRYCGFPHKIQAWG